MSSGNHHGVTLIELLVTLSILGVIASVTTLAIRRFDALPVDAPQQILADSVRRALATGRSIHVHILIDGRPANALVGMDGSILADSAFGVERFSGRPVDAR
jgi:prepilin-type N-terminal cleavage/methylation domain-containing protein